MKNCCDYNAIVHYHSGTFSGKYKTNLSGKLKETDLATNLTEDDVNSFQNGFYQTYITLEPIVLYRIYGQYQRTDKLKEDKRPFGARLRGRYVSTEFAESITDAKLRLALNPKWFNTRMYEAKIMAPAGITISVGIVASVTLITGTILQGGADQD